MASQATSGNKISFKRGDGGSPEAFTKIAEVIGVTGPGLKRNIIQTTNMDSGDWEEKLATTKDGGQIQLDLNFLPANATQNFASGLLHDYDTGNVVNYRAVWGDVGGSAWTCPCIVVHAEPSGAVGGRVQYKVTLEVSGIPTLV